MFPALAILMVKLLLVFQVGLVIMKLVQAERLLLLLGSTYTLRNLAATDHAITIRDASLGCVANTTATVGSPTPLSVNTPQVSQPIICLNASSGSINVSITNGAAPFTYKITGKKGFSQTSSALGDRNYTFTNLPADAYTVNVEGCNESVTASEIMLAAPINTTQLCLQPANISCSGSSEGQIEATISGGTAPYQIRLVTTTLVALLLNLIYFLESGLTIIKSVC